MPVNCFRLDEEMMPVDWEKFADDVTTKFYKAKLRETSKRTGNNPVRAHKRKGDSDPVVDKKYIYPEGSWRSSRLTKKAKLN